MEAPLLFLKGALAALQSNASLRKLVPLWHLRQLDRRSASKFGYSNEEARQEWLDARTGSSVESLDKLRARVTEKTAACALGARKLLAPLPSKLCRSGQQDQND